MTQQFHPQFYARELKTYVYRKTANSIIHNNPKLETTQCPPMVNEKTKCGISINMILIQTKTIKTHTHTK